MNNEIKEIEHIMICLKEHIALSDDEDTYLLDYITNLQEEIKEANDSITWWTNRFKAVERDNRKLKEENERLKTIWKDTNVIVKDDKTLVMNTNAYDTLQDYKSRCEKAIDKMQYIIDYGFDYDGFNTVESLKGLIDMLVDYARQSKNILQNGSENDEKS